MDDLNLMLSVQRMTYSIQVAYDYFRDELYQMLTYVFSRKGEMDAPDMQASEEKMMLRNAVITVAHKIYLDKLFAVLRAQNPPEPNHKK